MASGAQDDVKRDYLCFMRRGEDESLHGRFLSSRPGRREEVGCAVLFLASPEASYITGTALVVDGGLRAQ
jgi:3-oxoacyl-[acyl-carrier protein] reductase